MTKKMHVPTVTYTVSYKDQTYYYRESLNNKGGLVDLQLFDSNNVQIDEESDLFDEILTFLEGTFFELYREANF